MRKVALFISLLMACFICGAKDLTIIPQFAVGDTLRYRTITNLVMYHGPDSLSSTTKFLPTLIVEDKNDRGFVITTTNNLEDFSLECSDPAAGETLKAFDKSDILNDVAAAIVLRIQLDADCQPDSILNMDAVKERITEAYINMFAKNQEIDESNREKWEKETRPFIDGAVDMIYTPDHLIEQQFGNLPYFNFISIPLKSGKIPASIIITGDLLKMCRGVGDLDMKITQFDSNMENSISADDGMYSIKISGKKDNIEIEGLFLYGTGIMNHGILTVKAVSEAERLVTTYIINPKE